MVIDPHSPECAEIQRGQTEIVLLLRPHGVRDEDWLCGSLTIASQQSFCPRKYNFKALL